MAQQPMLSDERFIDIIQNAFRPMRCVAQIWDYDHKVRFQVEDLATGHKWTNETMTKLQAQQAHALASILGQTRNMIETKGYRLDAWEFPD